MSCAGGEGGFAEGGAGVDEEMKAPIGWKVIEELNSRSIDVSCEGRR